MLKSLRHQWQIWLAAVAFFTRLPLPASVTADQRHLNKLHRYFSLIGVLVGGLCAISYGLLAQWLPPGVCIPLVIVVGILITGGLHEDGLADICDGFGGGFSRKQKLAIMKDSRVGAYGVLALILLLLLKFQLLLALAEWGTATVVVALITAHAFSRTVAESLVHSLPYARAGGDSKVGDLFDTTRRKELLILVGSAMPLLLLLDWTTALVLLISLLLARQGLLRWFKRQIGGYTGDCLGAAQQLSELLCYLVLLFAL